MKKKLTDLIGWICCNESPITDGEWQKLCDYGHYPHRLGMQDFTREALNELVQNFATAKAKAGSRWRGVPITMGHRLARNEHLPDFGKKLGRVLDIDLRADGPYVKIAWNDLGQKNVAEGYAEFPSPEVLLKKAANGLMQPVHLVGIGMVENPNIPTSEAWTNEADPNNPNNPTETESMKAIAECLGCAEDEASILTAIKALQAKAGTADTMEAEADNSKKAACNEKERADKAEADLAALNEKVTTLTQERDAAKGLVTAVNEARRDELIAAAINEGRITEAERAGHVTAFNEDFDKALTTLKAKKPTHDTKAISLQRANARTRLLAANEAREQFAQVATDYAKAKGVSYQVAFNECLKDKQHAELVKAMNN